MGKGVSKFNPFETRKRNPNFNRRFTGNHDPDFNDLMMRTGRGEHSVHTQLAFEKYLKSLRGVR